MKENNCDHLLGFSFGDAGEIWLEYEKKREYEIPDIKFIYCPICGEEVNNTQGGELCATIKN